jgi:hypothetical protein
MSFVQSWLLYSYRLRIVAAILIPLAFAPCAVAQDVTGSVAEKPAAPVTVVDTGKAYVVALPVVYYTSETRLAFGGAGLLGFRLGDNAVATRRSSLPFMAVYTQNKQLRLVLKPEIYLPGDAYLISGTLRFERMPQDFYGVGVAPSSTAFESYSPQTIGLQLALKKRILPHVWAGVGYERERTTMKAVEPGKQIASGTLVGSSGGTVAGLGASVSVDTRDNVMFARRGVYLQLAADRYGSGLGGDFTFTSVILDLRAYKAVRESDVVAIQVYAKSRTGAPPFYQLAMLGGDSLLRGYYRGRYRDRATAVVQAEYRAHIWKRLGAGVFAGIGEACPSLGQCSASDLLPSYGGGLRIKLDSKGGTHMRIEYAGGRRSSAFLLTVQEAF